eukprot:1321781-Amorphochlora_amoeboformis.AAC.1
MCEHVHLDECSGEESVKVSWGWDGWRGGVTDECHVLGYIWHCHTICVIVYNVTLKSSYTSLDHAKNYLGAEKIKKSAMAEEPPTIKELEATLTNPVRSLLPYESQ